MKTLRMKILIPILIVTVLGLMSLAISSYYLSSQIIQKNIEDLASSKVAQLKGDIDAKLEFNMEEIAVLSRTEEVKSLNWDTIDQYIYDRLEYYSDYEEILLADTSGFYNATSGASGSIADTVYFQQALQGKDAISEPLASKTTGDQVIAFATPVKNVEGEVIAVLVGTYRFDIIAQLIKVAKIGDDGYAYIINREGMVLYHKDGKMISTNVLTLDSESLVDLTQKMIKGDSAIGHYVYNGDEKFMAYTPLKVNGWSVAITTTESDVTEELNKLLQNSALIFVIAILVIILSVYMIVHRLVKPIRALGASAQEMAKGNLRIQIDDAGQDEIGALAKDFNAMVVNIKQLLGEMRKSGETLAASSEEIQAATQEASGASENISRTMQQVSQGVSEQAVAAQRGSERVEDLVRGLTEIASSMGNSEKMTAEARENAKAGVGLVYYQKQKMDESKKVTHILAQEIHNLSGISSQIYEIIQVIGGIAEQTNLLALNAAIEAARAGEHGRGFSVVADEVRKLAEESGQATGRIGELIHHIQDGVQKAVTEMDRAGEVIQQQEEAVVKTTASFEGIQNLIMKVAEDVHQVYLDSESLNQKAQAAGSEVQSIASIAQESAAASEQVAATSQQQTASMEQLAGAAEDLAKLGVKLQEEISRFKL